MRKPLNSSLLRLKSTAKVTKMTSNSTIKHANNTVRMKYLLETLYTTFISDINSTAATLLFASTTGKYLEKEASRGEEEEGWLKYFYI